MTTGADDQDELAAAEARETGPFNGVWDSLPSVVNACMHPDCLSLPDVALEAQWASDDWEDVQVCVSHVPAATQYFLQHEHEGVLPWVVCIKLRPAPAA